LKKLVRPPQPDIFHPRKQSVWLYSEQFSRAVGTLDLPAGFVELSPTARID